MKILRNSDLHMESIMFLNWPSASNIKQNVFTNLGSKRFFFFFKEGSLNLALINGEIKTGNTASSLFVYCRPHFLLPMKLKEDLRISTPLSTDRNILIGLWPSQSPVLTPALSYLWRHLTDILYLRRLNTRKALWRWGEKTETINS